MAENIMTNRKKLLIIGSRVPYPPLSGGENKNYQLIRKLSQTFDLYLIFMTDSKARALGARNLECFAKSCTVVHVPKWKSYLRCIMALFSRKPIQVAFFADRRMRIEVGKALSQVDAVVVTLVRTAQYVMDAKVPKVLDMTDSIGLNYRNSMAKTKSRFWRYIQRIEADRLIDYERACIEAFDFTTLVNEAERQFFNRPEKTRWTPHGINEALFQMTPLSGKRRAIGFIGKMDYQPNVDAVLWFCEQVLPFLPPDLEFIITGTSPAAPVRALSKKHPQVAVTGYLADPHALLAECIAVVAPMQTGGGIQNKVLEAMAIGLPVVTTERAAAPITAAENGIHFLVEDEPEAFAKAIMRLAEDSAFRERLGTAGRALAQSTYTWSAYEAVVLECLGNAIATHSPMRVK